MNRRHFLRASAAAAIGAPALLRSQSVGSLVRVAVVGCSRNAKGGPGRGSELAASFAALSNVEVAAVCDVDQRNLAPVIKEVAAKSGKEPQGERDFRRLLEDKNIHSIIIATPDHWHTPAALLAMDAGKHVYLEKPCSHNPHEGELLVKAARKHQRHVQHGTQRRSWPAIREAIQQLHSGKIGRVLNARAYYFNARPTIGRGKPMDPPEWLDWPLWQGPAPDRPYRDNYVHYHWHWFWHWGTGELGNNGVHTIDVCRWGLGVDLPKRVTSAGEKLRYPDDDQESPDTNTATFDFGTSTITWENRSWSNKTPGDPQHDIAFFGEKGSLFITGAGYVMHDLAGAEIARGTGAAGNETHLQNFVDAIRGATKLNAEIEEGHHSTLMCHLGNIAWRTGHTIHFDPAKQRIIDDPKAEAHWKREYRAGWEPRG